MKRSIEMLSWEGALAIESTQARQAFRYIIDEAYAAGRRVVILRHGQAVAAIVAVRDFQRLKEHDRAADMRLLERVPEGEVQGAVPIEGIIAALEHGEKGNVHSDGDELVFGDVPAEQLAGDILTQYIESPEFLHLARAQIATVIREVTDGREALTAADAANIKMQMLASLAKHGLGIMQYA